jgi:hypothetical protein
VAMPDCFEISVRGTLRPGGAEQATCRMWLKQNCTSIFWFCLIHIFINLQGRQAARTQVA